MTNLPSTLQKLIDLEFTIGTPGWKAAMLIGQVALGIGYWEGFEVGRMEDD